MALSNWFVLGQNLLLEEIVFKKLSCVNAAVFVKKLNNKICRKFLKHETQNNPRICLYVASNVY